MKFILLTSYHGFPFFWKILPSSYDETGIGSSTTMQIMNKIVYSACGTSAIWGKQYHETVHFHGTKAGNLERLQHLSCHSPDFLTVTKMSLGKSICDHSVDDEA